VGHVLRFGSKELLPSIRKGEAFVDQKFLNGPLLLMNGTVSVARCMRPREVHDWNTAVPHAQTCHNCHSLGYRYDSDVCVETSDTKTLSKFSICASEETNSHISRRGLCNSCIYTIEKRRENVLPSVFPANIYASEMDL
jgi:hypothetical protein